MSPQTTRDVREPGRLRRAFNRLVASDTQLDAEQLRGEAQQAGATPVKECGDRTQVCVAGRLRSVVFTPRTNLPTLEAELYDGTGSITLVWLGRRRIAGIEPGRSLLVRGRVVQQPTRRVIFNPYYELQATGGQ